VIDLIVWLVVICANNFEKETLSESRFNPSYLIWGVTYRAELQLPSRGYTEIRY